MKSKLFAFIDVLNSVAVIDKYRINNVCPKQQKQYVSRETLDLIKMWQRF